PPGIRPAHPRGRDRASLRVGHGGIGPRRCPRTPRANAPASIPGAVDSSRAPSTEQATRAHAASTGDTGAPLAAAPSLASVPAPAVPRTLTGPASPAPPALAVGA
ncbi:hypothetical protein HR12_29355, partial [Microbacterium sp. SUBG005]